LIRHADMLVCLIFVMVIFAVYWKVPNFDFIVFDDGQYVTENHHVKEGLTLKSITWAFTIIHASYWIPLTWLSHMLDCQFYGMNPGGHHLTNLLFHIANTLLLFFVFRKMTDSLWQSGFVAALFALHPLHVESVAWVSERKDVLSTFFWMLTMWSYVWHVENPSVKRYVLIVFLYTLGLMSKPMLVTLPFVLLLLDFFPLYRIRLEQTDDDNNAQQWLVIFRLVWEKVPLFVLSAISSVVTFYAQQQGGAVVSLGALPLKARIANALCSYAKYMGKMVYPAKLAIVYPYSGVFPWWKISGSLLLLVSISFLAIRGIKQRPYLAVGWLWYLGTLVPVIGLVQVGRQSMADRFTYVPYIGLFIIIAWLVPELLTKWRYRKIWLAASATVILSIFTAVTWKQIGYWENSITLFEHTLKVTTNNYVAHNNLGAVLYGQDRTDEAIGHFLQALRIKPDAVDAYNNMGSALFKQGRTDEAIAYYLEALRIQPDYVDAHTHLGAALNRQGRTDEAIVHYLQALRIKPDDVKAHYNLGNALDKQDRTEEAIGHYLEALRIQPDYVDAYNNLGNVLGRQGRTKEAIDHYLQALRIRPDYEGAYYNLGAALFRTGDIKGAITCFREAIRINPDYVQAKNSLEKVLMIQQQDR